MENYLFSEGFNRIEIRASHKNKKSQSVPLYNKYYLDGELREDRSEKGEYHNTLIFVNINH